MHEYTDDNLLIQWKEGEETAFRQLYHRLFISLVKIAFQKTNDRFVAEEVVQDAFLALYIHKNKVNNQPMAWLQTVIKRKIIDIYRKKSKEALLQTLPEEEPAFQTLATDTIDYRELSEKIQDSINTLPEQCKKVFLLSREQQLTNKQIAEALGISIKTVEQHITKALKTLRSRLGAAAVLYFILEGMV